MVMDGRGRDVLTAEHGEAITIGVANVAATVAGASRELETFRSSPEVVALQDLIGAVVGPGFRAKVDAVVPEERESHSLVYLLLDDLPGAGLVSGYALLTADAVPKGRPDEYLIARSDLCAGWASDGSMMTMIREHGQNPTPLGPPAPAIDRIDDPDGWHEVAALPPTGMRRIRRIDVIPPTAPADPHRIDVFFRDSHADADGAETVVHEYQVFAAVDERTRTVVEIDAIADVLPWTECPAAVGSASRLVGHALVDLRPWVRETFVGTTTCTHLNDVLRGLSDVDVLLDQLAAATA